MAKRKSILDKRNNSCTTKNLEKLNHELHNSSTCFLRHPSPIQPKQQNKGPSKPNQKQLWKTTSLKAVQHLNWAKLLYLTINRMSGNYGLFLVVLFGCFCLGYTGATRECQGIIIIWLQNYILYPSANKNDPDNPPPPWFKYCAVQHE